MKKFRGFTLIESLTVVAIIGIISAALYNMRNVGNDYTDYRKEAVNLIYKEIEQSIKDFQRNKTRKDSQGNVHEIDSFQIKITDRYEKNTGSFLTVGNTYIYCTDNNDTIMDCSSNDIEFGSGFYDSKIIISGGNYKNTQNIKKTKQYKFYTTISGHKNTNAINIGKNGEIFNGENIAGHMDLVYSYYNSNPGPIVAQEGVSNENICVNRYTNCTENTTLTEKEKQYIRQQNNGGIVGSILGIFGIHIGNPNVTEDALINNKIKKCLGGDNFYEVCGQYLNKIEETVMANSSNNENYQIDQEASIIISAKDDNCENIGKITINSITKKVSLERCNNNRVTNGIDCGTNICE